MSFLRTQVFALVTLAVVPAVAVAQSGVKGSRTFSAYEKAVSLRQQAVDLYDEPHRAVDAARLHLAEARYRTPLDPEGVEALAMAAHLFNYSKRPLDARRAMEQAAYRALTIGDVNRAAQAFVEAAFLAQKKNNVSEMRKLGRKALLLAESPQLADEQRELIRRRIVSSPALAQAVK